MSLYASALQHCSLDPSENLDAFIGCVERAGKTLYEAQEEAVLEVFSGHHIILNTPTGSGKSLVAEAMHFRALCEGKRSFYTSPIKALVNEKFFALCRDFGAQNIGMLSGDASINPDAPIICCTAEILSNLALHHGADTPADFVTLDEFHYYSDPERGTAWQIPLLLLKKSQLLLMSATIGEPELIKESLEKNSERKVTVVSSDHRPVPLDFQYKVTPLHETLQALMEEGKSPIYMVNFTQADCAKEAQNATSINFATKEEKEVIKAEISQMQFDTAYGKDVKRFVSHGIGIHHAGILPKYRLLVEKLAQKGLLKVIMGTDTLGVGINIPIRTVLFTKLCKFDGKSTRVLSIRDFQQISGRAGRKGFDDEGQVIAQAPEHVVENIKAENKFASKPQKSKKKVVKKSAPVRNFAYWDEATFEKLRDSTPETLTSVFRVTHGMLLTILQGYPDNLSQGYKDLIKLIADCHENTNSKQRLRKHSAELFKTLVKSGILTVSFEHHRKPSLDLSHHLQKDFSLHQTLSLYFHETLGLLEEESEDYALDAISLLESILENPRIVLIKQLDAAKKLKLAELKAQGMEYEERIEALEKVEYPKPLAEFIYDTFNLYAGKHPWVSGENIAPKSIVREVLESGMSFGAYIKQYGLEKSEGVLLRYLSNAYKAMVQTIPSQKKNEALKEHISNLKELLYKVDQSLIDEWESLIPQSK